MIQRLSVCIKPVIDPSPFYESKKKENFIFPLFFSRSNDISRRNSCEERGGREKTVALIHRGSRRLINHLRLRDVWDEWMRARLKMWWTAGRVTTMNYGETDDRSITTESPLTVATKNNELSTRHHGGLVG